MTQCPRTDSTTTCAWCGNKPDETCPLDAPDPLPGEPITAGQTGTCAVDNPECESCQ